jgi:3-methyladenine DNA glycosylase Tag
MKKRCEWCEVNDLMRAYHDEEWGVPVHDDLTHFEFMVLDAFQAGLSWSTILNKRENFRKAFSNFDPAKVARYDKRKVARLLADKGIIRNRQKIDATIANAKAFRRLRLGIRGRQAQTERLEDHEADPAELETVRRPEQGAEAPRLQVRGVHHLLRLHAGGRHGERSRGGVLPVRARRAPGPLRTNFTDPLDPSILLL